MILSRLDRLSPLSGVIAVLLMIAGAVLVGLYDFLPPADHVANYLGANASRISAGGYLGTISAFFLIWFAGSLRGALREKEGGSGRLSEIAFGGGVAASALVALTFAGIGSAALRAGTGEGIAAVGAITIYDWWSQIMGLAFPVTIAVLIGATAIISLRTKIFPGWFGWVSALITVGLLTPFSYLALSLAIIWILVVSIRLVMPGRQAEEEAVTAGDVSRETA